MFRTMEPETGQFYFHKGRVFLFGTGLIFPQIRKAIIASVLILC